MKIQKIVLFLLFFSLLSHLKAGKIERAFEALGKYDYFGAKELFEKVKDKEPVAAPFGLSKIFGRNDNPFYNIDSAFHYILQAEARYPNQDTDQKAELKELGVSDSSISEWKDSIDLAAWNQTKEMDKQAAYQRFIEQHKDADQRREAIKIRNQLAFIAAKSINTARAYRTFLEKYPDAEQSTEAQNRYETQLFQEFTQDDEVFSYESFASQYPESPYKREALDSVYSKSTLEKTIPAYKDFIKKYPENPNVEQAWRNIYKLYTAAYSPERILEFRIEYPNYPFTDELMTDMKLAAKLFFPFYKEGKYGFIDEEGKVMIEPQYEVVEPYTEGLGLVVKNGELGFLNKAGDLVIPFDYDDGEPFYEGLAIVSRNDKYGMIDRTNKAVIPFQYDLVGKFSQGLALVANDTAYGFVGKEGKVVIPMILDYANDFDKGHALIEVDGKKGIINTKGRQVVKAQYEYLENFNRYGVARAKNDSAYGLIDLQGSEILPFEYERIGEFGDSLAMISKEGKYGYVNSKGEIQIPLKYDFNTEAMVWGVFESGYAKFKEGDKYGLLNTTGEEVYPAIFEDVGRYDETQLVAVKKRGKWGYADQKVKLQLPYEYELAQTFVNGRAKVKTYLGWQLIDEKGESLLDSAAMQIRYLDSMMLLTWNGKIGILDQELNAVLPPEYEGIRVYQYHYLQLKKGKELLYFDPKLKKLIVPKKE